MGMATVSVGVLGLGRLEARRARNLTRGLPGAHPGTVRAADAHRRADVKRACARKIVKAEALRGAGVPRDGRRGLAGTLADRLPRRRIAGLSVGDGHTTLRRRSRRRSRASGIASGCAATGRPRALARSSSPVLATDRR